MKQSKKHRSVHPQPPFQYQHKEDYEQIILFIFYHFFEFCCPSRRNPIIFQFHFSDAHWYRVLLSCLWYNSLQKDSPLLYGPASVTLTDVGLLLCAPDLTQHCTRYPGTTGNYIAILFREDHLPALTSMYHPADSPAGNVLCMLARQQLICHTPVLIPFHYPMITPPA